MGITVFNEREKLLLDILSDIASMLEVDTETKDEIRRAINKLEDMYLNDKGWR